jgi:hypothetical protein
MYRGLWRRGGMAKQPLNDLYLRTRMFAPAEMATEAHVWRSACSAIDGKSGVLTVIGQLLLALGFGRVPHGRQCPVEYPTLLSQRQMPALTTREQEARPSGVPRRVRAPVAQHQSQDLEAGRLLSYFEKLRMG